MNRIAGGNDTLLLGACFHLFGSASKCATYNVPSGEKRETKILAQLEFAVEQKSQRRVPRRGTGFFQQEVNYFFFFGDRIMIIWRPSIFGNCST
jgi:hypothetical protein